jgi:hypothetical protein
VLGSWRYAFGGGLALSVDGGAGRVGGSLSAGRIISVDRGKVEVASDGREVDEVIFLGRGRCAMADDFLLRFGRRVVGGKGIMGDGRDVSKGFPVHISH